MSSSGGYVMGNDLSGFSGQLHSILTEAEILALNQTVRHGLGSYCKSLGLMFWLGLVLISSIGLLLGGIAYSSPVTFVRSLVSESVSLTPEMMELVQLRGIGIFFLVLMFWVSLLFRFGSRHIAIFAFFWVLVNAILDYQKLFFNGFFLVSWQSAGFLVIRPIILLILGFIVYRLFELRDYERDWPFKKSG